MNLEEFNFFLPQELIAQEPFFPKEQTKMLVCKGSEISDSNIINLIDFLQEQDVLVFNNARVIKAKLMAKIARSAVAVEFNLDQQVFETPSNGKIIWRAICRGSRKVRDADIVEFAPDFSAKVKKLDEGFCLLEFDENNFEKNIEKYGLVPLPPYIKRDSKKEGDEENYQTIYAKDGSAVAAPTAGLHFTEKMFSLLEEKKIKKVFVTLNVGAGTFMPVRCDNILDHKMHEEYYSISTESAKIINEAKASGGRIIAVGTTSLRVLESASDENGILKAQAKKTNIFIYPSYKFKVVDLLITNFHLPKSTLFMLICAFVGKDRALEIYSHAIAKKYRFYSYGDASLLFKCR